MDVTVGPIYRLLSDYAVESTLCKYDEILLTDGCRELKFMNVATALAAYVLCD